MSSSEEDLGDNMAIDEDDLFGGDEDDALVEKTRELSDIELDSGDDVDRDDRAAKAAEDAYERDRAAHIMELSIWRHPAPNPSDGELNLFKLPKFLGIAPLPYDPDTFKIPESDHHSDTKSANFSANAVAATTMRYRTNASTGKHESNTVVYKWSDGSTTIAVGDQHYELQDNPLVPPKDKPYREVEDSHSYLASPSISSQLLLNIGHLTNQYTVRPNKDVQDDALERLQKSLAAASRRGANEDTNGPELITNTQDPELQKKRAEIAEKERLRAQRRRETAAEKAGLPGQSRSGRGGLSVDDLEGRSGRKSSGARPAAKRAKRRPDYDTDDEVPRGSRFREDEYDKEDDFLASSDEELEEGGGEDEEEEEEEELEDEESERERERPRTKKQKQSRQDETSDADADAEADLDEEAPAAPASSEPAGRGRKRNVIEDDDDE